MNNIAENDAIKPRALIRYSFERKFCTFFVFDTLFFRDVAICFEERIYELVEEDLGIREAEDFKALHIVNIETKDNPEAAAKSADLALKLCQKIEEQDDINDDLSDIIADFEEKHNVSLSNNTHML